MGEWTYYWREKGGGHDDTGLDVYHWCGPAVVCAVEPPADLDRSLLDRCYWLIQGSALLRCTYQQIRPETEQVRTAREETLETHSPGHSLVAIQGMLKKV